MSIELSKEIIEQIEQKANDYAQQRHDELSAGKGHHRKTLLRYAYQAGANKYAELWQAAEAKAERY